MTILNFPHLLLAIGLFLCLVQSNDSSKQSLKDLIPQLD